MKITVKETKIICSNPTNPANGYFAWPSVARLQDGRLAMVASGFRYRHICPFGKVVMCVSDDEGATWSRPAVIMDTPLDDRDAGILPFGERSLLVTSFNNTKEAQRGYNHQGYWETAERNDSHNPYIDGYLDMLDSESAEAAYLGSTFIISRDGGKTFGEVLRCPVTSPHGPTLTPDGEILYVGRFFGEPLSPDRHLAAFRLSPDGQSELLGDIPDVPALDSHEPHAIVLEDGRILVHIRVQGQGHFTVYQTESRDGGRSFDEPRPLLSDQGGSPPHLLRLRDGTLISTYGYRQPPYGIKVMISRDGGHTWDTDHDLYINGVHHDLGYPASVELINGDILTVFYARERTDQPAVIMQVVWRVEQE